MANVSNLSRSGVDSSGSDLSVSGSSNRSLRVAENRRRAFKDPFLLALKYFSEVEPGTPVKGNDVLEGHLVQVERVGLSQGLHPEAISVMLEFAMSLRMGASPCVRVLKCLIPASLVPQEAVVRGLSWMCVSKIPISTQVFFLKWVLTVFDMIDSKDDLRAIYGIIFSFVRDEHLSPFVCHLLYLLTRKESVQPIRVRKLLDLQAKLGRQPFLSQLLSLYKVFCPELVSLSLPSRMRGGFKNHNSPWKAALSAVQKNSAQKPSAGLALGDPAPGTGPKTGSRKRKSPHLELPPLSSAVPSEPAPPDRRTAVPLAQLRSFSQLLDNLHRVELPAQIGSVLGSGLTLHFLDCVQEDSAFHRLNFWLGHALLEEFLFCSDRESQSSPESLRFLHMLLSTQEFLQEGFSSTETFLYRFLSCWDGALLRPQILGLLSDVPVIPSSSIDQVLFQPLTQLFFSSTLFFKCGVIDCLNDMLVKWLNWHTVYALEDGLDLSLNSHTPINMTLSGFMDVVVELVRFVGQLASAGLQLEGGHTLLLSFVLDFYQTVCDIFLKYGLPLVVLPPAGVFYPALLATDPVSVDRLAYIMVRYKNNLMSAKSGKQTKGSHISRQSYVEFNGYLLAMVQTLYNSKSFLPGMAVELSKELLESSGVPEHQKSFNFIRHPAFVSHALDFHRKCWPERTDVDLSSIQMKKQWDWYLEFLYSQGWTGIKQFIHINISRPGQGGRDDTS